MLTPVASVLYHKVPSTGRCAIKHIISLSYFIASSHQSWEIQSIISPNLQMRKLRLRGPRLYQ